MEENKLRVVKEDEKIEMSAELRQLLHDSMDDVIDICLERYGQDFIREVRKDGFRVFYQLQDRMEGIYDDALDHSFRRMRKNAILVLGHVYGLDYISTLLASFNCGMMLSKRASKIPDKDYWTDEFDD